MRWQGVSGGCESWGRTPGETPALLQPGCAAQGAASAAAPLAAQHGAAGTALKRSSLSSTCVMPEAPMEWPCSMVASLSITAGWPAAQPKRRPGEKNLEKESSLAGVG